MPLVNLQSVLEKADKEKYAVGSFDVINTEMLQGVIAAAEETKSPVILAFAQSFEDTVAMDYLAPVMESMARRASVPVVVHLDHAVTFEYLSRAVSYGFTSVMIDASVMPFEDNVAITKKVIDLCRKADVSVEAELGHVSGGEAADNDDVYIYTDVSEASLFVKETGVDALAVAIGTVHGVYKNKPVLSLQRLNEIKQHIRIPIVLHGGSGLSDNDFREAISSGVSKINIFTDLTLAAMNSIRRDIEKGLPYMGLCYNTAQAVKEETIKKIKLFGSNGKAE